MRYLFCLLAAGLLFTGCQIEGTGSLTTTDNGTRYTLYTANRTGEPVKIGQYAYFHAAMVTQGDSIMFGTRQNGGEPQVLQIKDLVAAGPDVSPVEDVLSLMAAGDSAVIRVNMDQFPSKPPGLENDSVLLYTLVTTEILDEETHMERLSVEEKEKEEARQLVLAREDDRLAFAEQVLADYKAGKLDGKIETTDSGLKVMVHQEGTGAQAEAGRGVKVQYIGKLISDGSVFDQSFGRGEAISFLLGQGQVIPGWDEGIALLKEGAQATLFIPSELAYGARGAGPDIPPNSELAFYVELEEVQ
ncbi:MAG: FKBP-type peptidyl-prolyl cis-trans isomerase [Bacteroidota bacterium]